MKVGTKQLNAVRALSAFLFSGAAVCALASIHANAQPVPAQPGSPAATITIDGSQLPAPPQQFHGKIGRNVAQSTPYWPARIKPPKGAPNILLIMTDDVGFGAPSTFGGVIPTPALDYVAKNGLRYTNFHSTALCSPTRAALITGRNHQSVGFGSISEAATGYPGYDSIIPKNKATIGTILKDNGYVTAWFGKDHNTPAFQTSAVGPFDQWPTGMGFDYFYGFVGGDTSQWSPGNLYRDTTHIYPYVGHPGWNLTTAMADDAIGYIKQLDELKPDQKWFVLYVPGGTHAPHQPTPEWIDKISAMHLFDKGWNALRQQIFENQKKLGVIPQSAKLTPWPDKLFKNWDDLTIEQKKLYIRQADVYAAYLAYTDHEIGRVIDEVKREGKLDNTLIIYISGDNGASAEGGFDGTPNEVAQFNGLQLAVQAQLGKYAADWGTDKTYAHMAAPWAWAFDTPFSWTKQVASHFGGTKQGMAISWPDGIADKGGIRWQFHHVIDVVPTILQVTGIKAPTTVDGIKQAPIEGVSMAYTFPQSGVNVPSNHHVQYFEMMGDRAIYQDGWIASTKVMRAPWALLAKANPDPSSYPWELYNLRDDWTQYDDVAAKYPKKLAEMKALFLQQAEKYQVLPLDASVASRMITPKPSITADRRVFNYSGELEGVPNSDAPSLLDTSYDITADVDVPADGGNGMIVTQGGRFAGYGFYLLEGKPVFLWDLLDMQRVRWEGGEALAPGHHTLNFDFKYDGLGLGTLAFNNLSGIGRGGTGTLKVDGKVVATRTMDRTLPLTLQWDENFDVGLDTGTPVDDQDYQVPFRFTGKINHLTITLDPPQLSPSDVAKLKAAQTGNVMSE